MGHIEIYCRPYSCIMRIKLTTERVGQLVRGCPTLTKVSCSSLGHAAALKLGWESFAALVVLPGSNPDLVGAPVVPDTGWFNQKKINK